MGATTEYDGGVTHATVSIYSLVPHEENYNVHPPEQIEDLKSSLRRYGQVEDAIVKALPDGRYKIAAHEGVTTAALELLAAGECPQLEQWNITIVPPNWTDLQVKGYMVTSNRSTLKSYPDENILAALLQEQQGAGYDLASLGADEETLARLVEQSQKWQYASEEEEGDGHLADDGTSPDSFPSAPGSSSSPSFTPLASRFLVPPFSVFDARQGYWQARKRAWIALGIQSELGRDAGLALQGEGITTESGHFYRRKARGLLDFSPQVQSTYPQGKGRMRGTPRPVGKGGLSDQMAPPERLNGRIPRSLPIAPGGQLLIDRYRERDEPDEPSVAMSGTSIFDPVLCEVIYRWFSPRGGAVLDPFAGGSVRGIVASALGRSYVGIDLRAEQVAANEQQANRILRPGGEPLLEQEEPQTAAAAAEGEDHHAWMPHSYRQGILRADERISADTSSGSVTSPTPSVGPVSSSREAPRPAWLVGDSREMEGMLPTQYQADMVFTCPPYYDLEVYSDLEADLSRSPTYEAFLEGYQTILHQALLRLKQDRFACIVVSNIRDKQGLYRSLVADTVEVCRQAGLFLYNDAILLTVAGSLPVRVGYQFPTSRKLGKTHQNVLIFVKGDARRAVAACGPISVQLPALLEALQSEEALGAAGEEVLDDA